MKTHLITLIILIFSINAFAAPAIKNVKDVKFKNYFLTYEDLSTLSEKERTEYVIGLLSLKAIMERTQDNFWQNEIYVNTKQSVSSIETQNENLKIKAHSKLDLLIEIIQNKAQAGLVYVQIAGLVLTKGWRFIAPAGEKLFELAVKYGGKSKDFFSKSGLKTVETLTEKTVINSAKGVAKKFNLTEEVVQNLALIKRKSQDSLKLLAEAKKAKDPFKKLELEKQAASLKDEMAEIIKTVTPDADKQKKLLTLFDKAPMNKKAVSGSVGGIAATLGLEAYINSDKIEELASSIPTLVGSVTPAIANTLREAANAVEEFGGNTNSTSKKNTDSEKANIALGESISPELTKNFNPELSRKLGYNDIGKNSLSSESIKEGNGCIFGLWSSQWIKKDNKIKCQRPAESSIEGKCSGEMFMCPNLGMGTEGISTETLFCIKYEPRNNVSVRCLQNFKELIDSKKLVITQEGYNKSLEHFKFNFGISELSYNSVCDSKNMSTECKALSELVTLIENSKAASIVIAKENADIATGAKEYDDSKPGTVQY